MAKAPKWQSVEAFLYRRVVNSSGWLLESGAGLKRTLIFRLGHSDLPFGNWRGSKSVYIGRTFFSKIILAAGNKTDQKRKMLEITKNYEG